MGSGSESKRAHDSNVPFLDSAIIGTGKCYDVRMMEERMSKTHGSGNGGASSGAGGINLPPGITLPERVRPPPGIHEPGGAPVEHQPISLQQLLQGHRLPGDQPTVSHPRRDTSPSNRERQEQLPSSAQQPPQQQPPQHQPHYNPQNGEPQPPLHMQHGPPHGNGQQQQQQQRQQWVGGPQFRQHGGMHMPMPPPGLAGRGGPMPMVIHTPMGPVTPHSRRGMSMPVANGAPPGIGRAGGAALGPHPSNGVKKPMVVHNGMTSGRGTRQPTKPPPGLGPGPGRASMAPQHLPPQQQQQQQQQAPQQQQQQQVAASNYSGNTSHPVHNNVQQQQHTPQPTSQQSSSQQPTQDWDVAKRPRRQRGKPQNERQKESAKVTTNLFSSLAYDTDDDSLSISTNPPRKKSSTNTSPRTQLPPSTSKATQHQQQQQHDNNHNHTKSNSSSKPTAAKYNKSTPSTSTRSQKNNGSRDSDNTSGTATDSKERGALSAPTDDSKRRYVAATFPNDSLPNVKSFDELEQFVAPHMTPDTLLEQYGGTIDRLCLANVPVATAMIDAAAEIDRLDHLLQLARQEEDILESKVAALTSQIMARPSTGL